MKGTSSYVTFIPIGKTLMNVTNAVLGVRHLVEDAELCEGVVV